VPAFAGFRPAARAEEFHPRDAALNAPALVPVVVPVESPVERDFRLDLTIAISLVEWLGPALRMERLAPNVLLYLVAGTINRVAIHEPAEGVHFGIAATGNTVNLRYITVPPDITRQPTPQPGDDIRDNDSARTGKKSVVTIGTRGAALIRP
jgi:hypothetical protein